MKKTASGDLVTVCSFQKQHSVSDVKATSNYSQQGKLYSYQNHLLGQESPHLHGTLFASPQNRQARGAPATSAPTGGVDAEPRTGGRAGAWASSQSWLESNPLCSITS